jgi:hypothetical protein
MYNKFHFPDTFTASHEASIEVLLTNWCSFSDLQWLLFPVKKVLEELRSTLTEKHLIVSIAAGVTLEQLQVRTHSFRTLVILVAFYFQF